MICVMTNRKKGQRKHKRFGAPIGTYVALRPDFVKVGQITDISVGGLAFDYVGDDEGSSAESRESFRFEAKSAATLIRNAPRL